jgi:hypothetical protein
LLNTMDHLKLNCKNDMWMVLVLFRSNPTSPPIFHSFLYYYYKLEFYFWNWNTNYWV